MMSGNNSRRSSISSWSLEWGREGLWPIADAPTSVVVLAFMRTRGALRSINSLQFNAILFIRGAGDSTMLFQLAKRLESRQDGVQGIFFSISTLIWSSIFAGQWWEWVLNWFRASSYEIWLQNLSIVFGRHEHDVVAFPSESSEVAFWRSLWRCHLT